MAKLIQTRKFLLGALLPIILFAQYESLNVRFIGNWPFGACHAVSCDPSRNLVFLGSGGGVYIYNVSNPSNPVKVSEKIHSRGLITGIFYSLSDQRLYIAARRGTGSHPGGSLEIWNVSNLSNPSRLGNYWTRGACVGVYVSGSYAYVADGNSGLRIIDVSNPSNPFEVAFIDTLGDAYDVFVSGNYAYVANWDGVHIINISNPANPQMVGFYDAPNDRAIAIYVSGSYLYVGDDTHFHVVDVSNPSNPQEIGNCSYWDWHFVDIYVSGNYAYALSEGRLSIINISNPYNPYEVGDFSDLNWALEVWVFGSYAYVAEKHDNMGFNAGLCIIDISDPTWPHSVAKVITPSICMGLDVFGSYAYLTGWGVGLRVIDISNPSEPVQVGLWYDTLWWGQYNTMDVSGSYAYLGDCDGGLDIIDISVPSNPVRVGRFGYIDNFMDIQVVYPYAYVAALGDNFVVINVSNPRNPQIVSSLTWDYDVTYGVFVSGNYAYITGENTLTLISWLRIIDVSDPSNPQELGMYILPGSARDVEVLGRYAYVTYGLYIIDISNPHNPQFVGSCPTRGEPWDIDLSFPYAYIADGDSGLCVIDVSNPSNPQIVGFYETPDFAYDISVDSPYVYIADNYTGLQIYRHPPSDSEVRIRESLNKGIALSQAVFAPIIFTDEIKIKFVKSADRPLKINLYNVLGSCVFEKALALTPNSITLSGKRIEELPSGVYFLSIYSGRKNLGKIKLIKQ
jgi:hypothetical protein